MDRYKKVEKPRAETPIDQNEIRITSQGRMRSYITYAMSLLQEKGSDEIAFKAMGRAINKTVTIVELIKRRIVGLHQITSITSTDISDTWEPLEEGLLPLQTTRHVSMITITLSKKELDVFSVGYQPPIHADQVRVSTEIYYGDGSPTGRGRGRGGRGRGRRGISGNGYVPAEYDDGDQNRSYGRGRGRGRGRNFRGRGRGGYNNGPQMDVQEDMGGYDQEAPVRVRGNGYVPAEYDDGDWDQNQSYEGGRGRGRGRNFRGRGRGGYNNSPQMGAQEDMGGDDQEAPVRVRGNGYVPAEYDDGGWDQNRSYGRGRGRGRGRNFRGRGRGGYNNSPQMDAQEDMGGYDQEARVRGRGNGYVPAEYDDGDWDQNRSYGVGRGRGRGRNFRGRGRGGYNNSPQMGAQEDMGGDDQEAPVRVRGNGYVLAEYDDGGWDQNRSYGRGRGRGRGRNFRGRGRGYNNSPQMDAQEDMGGYDQEAPVRGRGRGRGFRPNGPINALPAEGP